MTDKKNNNKPLKAPQPPQFSPDNDDAETNMRSRANRRSVATGDVKKSDDEKANKAAPTFASNVTPTTMKDDDENVGQQQQPVRGAERTDNPVVPLPRPPQDSRVPGAFAVGSNREDSISLLTGDEEIGAQQEQQQEGTSNDTNVDSELVNAELVDPEAERQRIMNDAEAQIRHDIIKQAPEAKLVDPAIARRRKRCIIIIGVILLTALVIGASVGGVYGKRAANAAALVSTPTISPAPSFQPSFAPSSSPTIFHDECQDARLVSSLPYFGKGRTDLAQELGDDSPALTCSLVNGFDRGVWYEFVGNGGCISASATGTNFDTKLAVFQGSSCEEELVCVTQNDGTGSALAAEVTWTSQAGQTYFILVAGVDSAVGDFTMTLSDVGLICNIVCEDPVVVNSLPFSFAGDTELAPVVDPDSGAQDCFVDLINDGTAGTWFEMTGTGSCISISTAGSELDTVLALYEGSCDALTCLTANDNARSDGSSELLFFAEPNKQYRLLVANSIFAGRGKFNLTITEPSDAECGDHGFICEYDSDASNYNCIFPRQGSYPFNSTASSLFASCQEYPFAEPTPEGCTCFVVVGEIENIGFDDVCQSCEFLSQANATDGDWAIAYDCSNILTGPCVGVTETGECIASNETEPTFPASEYSCDNGTVVDALPFSESASVFTLRLLGVDADAFACPTIFPNTWAGWYSLNGTGSCLRASTEGSAFDTKLAVYSGCGNATCLRENDDVGTERTSQIEWYGREGETYHVLLTSLSILAFGEYSLSITEFDCTPNEACAEAKLITDAPFSDSGSTTDGDVVVRRSQALACSVVERGAIGVWYAGQTIVATSCITASTAGSLFNTVLAVYNGSCDSLTCVVDNDDSSSLVRSSEVSWTAERGVLYYMFVGGARNATGEYSISLTLEEGVCS